MATGTLPAGMKDTDPHPQCKSQTRTRTRDPRRVESYARTRHPRVRPRTRREPWRSGRRTADAGRGARAVGRRHSLLASSWGAGTPCLPPPGGLGGGRAPEPERAGGGGLEERCCAGAGWLAAATGAGGGGCDRETGRGTGRGREGMNGKPRTSGYIVVYGSTCQLILRVCGYAGTSTAFLNPQNFTRRVQMKTAPVPVGTNPNPDPRPSGFLPAGTRVICTRCHP